MIYANEIMLKFMPNGNRFINPALVRKIKRSMLCYGITSAITVIQTDIYGEGFQYYILDGQHRYEAAKSLNMLKNLPVMLLNKKVLSSFDLINIVTTINQANKGWTIDDYVRVYASTNLSAYKTLITLKNTYGLSYGSILYLISDYDTIQKSNIRIKKGDIVIKFIKEQDLNLLKLSSVILTYIDDVDNAIINRVVYSCFNVFNDINLTKKIDNIVKNLNKKDILVNIGQDELLIKYLKSL